MFHIFSKLCRSFEGCAPLLLNTLFCIFLENKNLLSTKVQWSKSGNLICIQYYYLLSFSSVVPVIFFFLAVCSGPGCNSGPHNAFRCQFHLVYFNPELFLPFPLSFCSWPWFFWGGGIKVQGNDFVECPSVLVALMFAYIDVGYVSLDRI